MLSKRLRFTLMGLIITSAVSFLAVSCVSYIGQTGISYIDMSDAEMVQLEVPEDDDPVAVIKTSMGDIKAVLYPELAPNAVENFVELAESGYYDNTYIFQSEPGVYIGAGAPNKNGEINKDADQKNETIPQELHKNLWPVRGSLCSMVTGTEEGFFKKLTGDAKTLNGSRFAVLNSVEFTDDIKKELVEYAGEEGKMVSDAFLNCGGVPNLSQQITIFGQTYEGFDVIDTLTSVEITTDKDDEDAKVPVEDIFIETIEIATYKDYPASEEALERFEEIKATEPVTETATQAETEKEN